MLVAGVVSTCGGNSMPIRSFCNDLDAKGCSEQQVYGHLWRQLWPPVGEDATASRQQTQKRKGVVSRVQYVH